MFEPLSEQDRDLFFRWSGASSTRARLEAQLAMATGRVRSARTIRENGLAKMSKEEPKKSGRQRAKEKRRAQLLAWSAHEEAIGYRELVRLPEAITFLRFQCAKLHYEARRMGP